VKPLAGRLLQNQGTVVAREIVIYIPAYSSKIAVATAYLSNRTKNNAFFWPTSIGQLP
jgi:hypothetical protein